jgi:hypothetical protein
MWVEGESYSCVDVCQLELSVDLIICTAWFPKKARSYVYANTHPKYTDFTNLFAHEWPR